MLRPVRLVMIAVLFLMAASVFGLENWSTTLQKYTIEQPPKNMKIVTVSAYILSISDINDKDHSFKLQMFFRQQWNDSQLAHYVGRQDKFSVVDHRQIWTPDLFFTQELDGHFHDIVKENVFVRVFPNGTVYMSQRISLRLSCAMYLRHYPFDRQTCDVQIESYGYTADQIMLRWRQDDGLQLSDTAFIDGFSLRSFNSSEKIVRLSTNQYSALNIEFVFQRHWRFYLVQIFIPVTMLVILAWSTFWVSEINIRVTMLMFTIALAVICISDFNKTLPKTSYTKMLDVFTGIALTFIFAAVIRFVDIRRRIKDSSEKEDEVEKLDAPWRIGFAVCYVAFVVLYALVAFVYVY